MGWAFISSKRGRAWIRKEYDRGAWMYDGEADLGNGAAIRMAETFLTDDPLFGWISYGGNLERKNRSFNVIPKDGLRNRFSIITKDTQLSIELGRDGFLEDNEISVNTSLDKIKFKIENRTADVHTTSINIFTMSNNKVTLLFDGKEAQVYRHDANTLKAEIDISKDEHIVEFVIK